MAMYSAFFLASLGLFLDFAEAVFPSKLLHPIKLVFVIFIMDPSIVHTHLVIVLSYCSVLIVTGFSLNLVINRLQELFPYSYTFHYIKLCNTVKGT